MLKALSTSLTEPLICYVLGRSQIIVGRGLAAKCVDDSKVVVRDARQTEGDRIVPMIVIASLITLVLYTYDFKSLKTPTTARVGMSGMSKTRAGSLKRQSESL
jgi:hypothetical protein